MYLILEFSAIQKGLKEQMICSAEIIGRNLRYDWQNGLLSLVSFMESECNKGIVIMNDKLFARLWMDALEQPNKELYIAEYGYPDWFDEISEDPEEITAILGNIHDVANMTIKEMVKRSGFSQAGFSEHFCIPKRTVESWCMGERSCPDYVRLMMARLLGYLQ